MESRKLQAVFGGLIHEEGKGLYTETLLCLEFFTLVICFSSKRNRTRQKNNAQNKNKLFSYSNKPFYYLTANKPPRLSQFGTISFIKT